MTCSHCSRCWNLLYIYKEDLLWVWTGWGVSITSTNRGSKCKTRQITLRSHRAYNKAGVTSLWPSTTVEGAEALYICIKKSCYEYELDGGYQSQVLTEDPSANPATSHLGPIEKISGWSCILMTTGHCSRCWNTLYIYNEDLLWEWTGRGVSYTSTNRDSYSCTKHITLRSHRAYNKAGAASLWPLATVEGAETLYIYIKKTC